MSNDVELGAQYVRGLTDDQRKTAAYNALNAAYGPAVAYDPTNAFNAAKASAGMPLAPQAAQTDLATAQANLQGKQLENTDVAAQQQRLAGYRAAQLLKSSADPQTGAVSGDAFDKLIVPNAGMLGLDPAHVAPLRDLLTAPGGAQHLDTISQALIGPTKITGATAYGTDANGNSVALERDQYGNVRQVPLNGTQTTGQENAQTNQARLQERVRQDAYLRAHGWTTAQIAEYRASTGANNSLYGAGGATLPAIPGGGAAPANNTLPKPSVDLIGAGNPPGSKTAAQPAPKASLIDSLPIKGQVQVRSQATQIVNNQTTYDQAMRVADSMDKQISPWSTGPGSMLPLPGSVQNDLRRNAQTLQAAAAQAVLTGMKNAQGSTGIGRILQAEYKNFTNVYGNMETDQSAAQFKQHLGFLRDSLTRIIDTQRSGFQAQWKQSPESAIGMPERSTGAAPDTQAIVDELRRRNVVK